MKKLSYLIFFFLLTVIIIFSQVRVSQIEALNEISKPKSTWKQNSSTLDFHGFCYGAFRYFGPPGEIIRSENVEEDLEILKKLNVTDIRTYGMNYGQDVIPTIVHEKGINIATGIWLEPNTSLQTHFLNEYEISLGLKVANISSTLIVGNEVLLREAMSISKLIKYISKVQNKTSTPVTTAEPWHIWDQNPRLVNACDVIFVHVYSFWEGKPSPTYGKMAAEYTVEKIEYLQNKYPYKEIYLAEAGWPSGPWEWDPDRYSEPVQKGFYKDLLPILAEKGIKSYLFEAFDEKWKEDQEPGVGPNWGIFREDRTPKPAAAVLVKYFGGSVEWPEPTINSPKDFEVVQNEIVNISWIVHDIDNTSGTYTVYSNNTIFGQQNNIWINGSSINITVDTTTVGSFNYTIIFTDGISTGHDTVMVTVVEYSVLAINSPEDIEVFQDETVNLTWIIFDSDTMYGTYTVYLNNNVLGQQNAIWKNNTSILIPIDTSTVGTFNYTIVFTDGISTGQDMVIVIINLPITSTTSTATTSPGFNILVWIISLSAILSVRIIFLKKRKFKEN